MNSRLKKWVRYSLIFLGLIVMIPASLYFLLQIPSVQTSVVRGLTNRLSEKFQSEIAVGRVEYRFFNRISLDSIIFKDTNHDTLLYADNLTAGIRNPGIRDGNIMLGRISIVKPVFGLVSDTSGQMNIKWYLEKLREKKDTAARPISLSIDRIDIKDARFVLKNLSPEKKNNNGKISFSDLELSELNGIVEDLRVKDDTTSFSVYKLSFTEKSGFRVKELNSDISLSGTKFVLESTYINTDSSRMDFEKINILADSSAAFRNFMSDVKLDIRMKNSTLHTHDLGFFAPLPDALHESVTLSGRLTGTIAELRAREITLGYNDYSTLECDFDISGLPDINNAFIYIGITSFNTNIRDIEKIMIAAGKKNVPEALHRIGNISFSGSFSGFTTDFVTYGEFRTALGSISTDISLRPDRSQSYRMQGLINGINIDLGEISGSEIPGEMTIHANIDAIASSIQNFSGNLTGRIDSIEINNYNYRNIELEGKFTEKTWDGSINIVDDNIRMDLLGMFSFRDTLPEFDFTLNLAEANLNKLNIDKSDSTSALSMIMTSNFRGSNIDNLDGEIRLLSSSLTKHGETIELYDFAIRTFFQNNEPVLSLHTDFVDAEIKGEYSFGGLKQTIATVLSSVFPSLSESMSGYQAKGNNDFTFAVNFKNTNRINEFFRTGLMLSEKSFIEGTLITDTVFTVEAFADFVLVNNIRLNNLNIQAGTSASRLTGNVNAASLLLPGNTELKNFSISMNSLPDTIDLKAEWNNREDVRNEGIVKATGFLAKNPVTGNPVMNIRIDSSEVYANNNRWKINQSFVTLDSTAVVIDDIHISSDNRYYHVDGALSGNTSDTLHLAFRGIDIAPLNHIRNVSSAGKISDTTKIKMDLRGKLSGNVALTSIYENPLLESNITVNDFSILGNDYGDIYISSEFDYSRKVVDITANNDLEGTRMFNLEGYYDPAYREINIDFTANKLPVGALNPLLRSFASDISGYSTGKLNLSGTTDYLVLNGALKTDSVKMRINYLQTVYTINDSVRFDKKGIQFNNVRFSDEEGKPATLNGTVFHKNFRNYTADLTINMSNDFKVLNTQYKDNPMFYGTVYASGMTRIVTRPELLSFEISATTGRNTRFSIPLTDELSVDEYPFITFVNIPGQENNTRQPQQEKQLGLDINIDLQVTSEAEAEIIFDEKVGDKMTGSGSGMLNINLNPKGDFRITGDYIIEKGDYLFTLGNILNKRFEVENGGRIMFNGDLDDAEIELRAIYQKFNTSLYPILQDPERDRRVSVEPQLLLSGRLFNPTVKFEINLPDSDEETKTYLRNAVAAEEDLSRQFLYLLVMKSFYSEQNTSQASSSPTGTTAMAATTFEMVTNQLSNWISQINENFNLGLNYQPGTGDRRYNPDEVQLAFETQILDDRVILNGNFDYRASTGNSTKPLTGDFEAEVKITEKVRFKVFNRFNDISSGKGQYTQGVGIFFKEDFEKLSDLFKKRNKQSARKEEEITLMDPGE